MQESRESIFVANKIYNDVLKFIEDKESFCSQTLIRKFKIGYSTAYIIIDKLISEEIIEKRYGTYWVIKNEKKT